MRMSEVIMKDKCSKSKAIGIMIKKLRLIQQQMKSHSVEFSTNVGDIPLNPKLERVFEFIWYAVEMNHDIEDIKKKIEKNIQEYDIDLVEYFSYKYTLTLVARTTNFSDMIYSDGNLVTILVIILLFLDMIELIKFRTDKRKVTGVNIDSNTIKYVVCPRSFDLAMTTFRDDSDFAIIEREIERMVLLFRKGQRSKMKLKNDEVDDLQNVTGAIDTFDDAFRFKDTLKVLIDIIRQKTGLEFSDVNEDEFMECLLDHKSIIFRARTLQLRNRLTAKDGTLLRSGEVSMLLKDVTLTDNFAFIIASYSRYGVDNTIVLSLTNTGALNIQDMDALHMIYSYYGLEDTSDNILEFENINPRLWSEHKTNFRDVTKDAHYYKRYVEPYLRKINGQPSEKALALAKKYHIIIPEGKTLVDEQVREYHKDMKEPS